MSFTRLAIVLLACLPGLILSAAPQNLGAQDVQVQPGDVLGAERSFSPYADQHFPQRIFWGDTHHHTILSFDDGLMGTKLGPEDSFRFARGEEVVSNTGIRGKLLRPFDFLVVSDHAEYLGLADLIRSADPDLLSTEYGWGRHGLPHLAAQDRSLHHNGVVEVAT